MAGLKMDSARERPHGRLRSVIELQRMRERRRPPLQCAYCVAGVDYVTGHWRHRGREGQSWVDPFLRLSRGAEHALNCGFTAVEALHRVVRASRAVEDVQDLFAEVEGGYEFRLGPVRDGFLKLHGDFKEAKAGSAQPGAAAGRPGRAFVTLGEASHYLRTATGVARLRALVASGGEADLAERITIRTRDGILSWLDFFYEEDRLRVLHKKLIALQKRTRAAARKSGRKPDGRAFLGHPVAIEFTAKAEGTWRGARSIQGYSVKADKGKVLIPRLSLRGEWPTPALEPQRTYVILIEPWVDEPPRPKESARENGAPAGNAAVPSDSEAPVFQNIYGNLYNPSQIAAVIESEVGLVDEEHAA